MIDNWYFSFWPTRLELSARNVPYRLNDPKWVHIKKFDKIWLQKSFFKIYQELDWTVLNER
jgi:hypothetical protein